MLSQQRSDSRSALGLGLTFLALYLATLCPTVFRGDSGELVAALVLGEAIHPPGYPLFTLLGKLSLVLVPFGEPAFRVGCLVALSGAAAVACLFRSLRALDTPTLPALGAAAFFGVSLTFWSQCNRVEVYSLHLFLVLLATWQCLSYRESGQERALFTACVSVGLGLAHHLTMVLLIPGFLLLCGARLWQRHGLARRLLVGVALLVLTGLPLYGLLWGKLEGPEAFWAHVTGRAYRVFWEPPTSLDALRRPLQRAGAIFAENGFIPLSVLAVAGAVFFVRRRQGGVLAGFLLMALVLVAYCLCYTIEDIASYYLVPLALGVVLVGVALGQADRVLEQRQRPQALRYALSSLLPLLGLVLSFPACNLRAATGIRELARQKLLLCPPNATLLCQGDEDTYSLRYTHQLLKVRPDVTVLDAKQLAQTDRSTLTKRPLAATYFGTSAQNATQLGEALELEWLRASYLPVPRGVILLLVPKATPPRYAQVLADSRSAWEGISLPELPPAPTATEVDGDYTRRHYVTMLCNAAFLHEQAGQPEAAQEVFVRALTWAPELTRASLQRMQERSPVAARLLAQLSRS